MKFMSKNKDTAKVLTKSKIDSVHFVELIKEPFIQNGFFISSKFSACLFF